jgi:hypothetical protein
MNPITLTALIGLGILALTYIVKSLLILRWVKISREVQACIEFDAELTESKFEEMMRRLNHYASVIKVMRQLTMQIPILASILLIILITSLL